MRQAAQLVPRFAGLSMQPTAQEIYAAAEFERFELMVRLEAFHKGLRAERRIRFLRQAVSFWPVAAGLLLGAFAQTLQTLVAVHAPGAMTAIFPLYVLAGRLDLHAGGVAVQALPQFLLFGQFPLEGLLIRLAMKRRVTISGVIGRVGCMHLLVLAHLWLASGALNQLASR